MKSLYGKNKLHQFLVNKLLQNIEKISVQKNDVGQIISCNPNWSIAITTLFGNKKDLSIHLDAIAII